MNYSLIYLTMMRHGRSRADDEGVHEGRYDSPLTAVGQAQAQARAGGWQRTGVTFDQVIASPLLRAKETAQIVALSLNIPIDFDEDWMEVNNGLLAGMKFAEAAKRFPPPAFRAPFERIAETGETDLQIYCRAARALERVIQRGPGRYLVVAHGGILNSAMRVASSTPIPINYAGLWFGFGDTGYVRLTYDISRHRWTLLEFTPGHI